MIKLDKIMRIIKNSISFIASVSTIPYNYHLSSSIIDSKLDEFKYSSLSFRISNT